jgi:hypothetical protein
MESFFTLVTARAFSTAPLLVTPLSASPLTCAVADHPYDSS